jgi:hypothetical protein
MSGLPGEAEASQIQEQQRTLIVRLFWELDSWKSLIINV